jgi:hypothetical protein
MSNYFTSMCPTCSADYKGFANYLNGAPIVYAKAGPSNIVGSPYNFGAPGFSSINTPNRSNYSSLGGKAYKQSQLFSAPYSARGCSS